MSHGTRTGPGSLWCTMYWTERKKEGRRSEGRRKGVSEGGNEDEKERRKGEVGKCTYTNWLARSLQNILFISIVL